MDVEGRGRQRTRPVQPGLPLSGTAGATPEEEAAATPAGAESAAADEPSSPEFFEHPGPLFGVRIAPSSGVVAVGQSKPLRAVARDRSRRPVERDLAWRWEIVEGGGILSAVDSEIVTFTAPQEPMLCKVRVTVVQGDVECQAEALITVTDSLLPEKRESADRRGLPNYTFQKAPDNSGGRASTPSRT